MNEPSDKPYTPAFERPDLPTSESGADRNPAQSPPVAKYAVGTLSVIVAAAALALAAGYLWAQYEERRRREHWLRNVLAAAQELARHPQEHLPFRDELRSLGSAVSDSMRHLDPQKHLQTLNPFHRERHNKFLGLF
jgi:Flp pilus assembly protein TadB